MIGSLNKVRLLTEQWNNICTSLDKSRLAIERGSIGSKLDSHRRE